MRSIRELKDIKNKKILLRVDFDVPVVGSEIMESFRIKKQKDTIDYLISSGAKVTAIGHISSIDSFSSILPQLEEILGRKIHFLSDARSLRDQEEDFCLLDNIRKWPEEEADDVGFASRLSEGFDIYVNNAFAVSHRKHASISAIAGLLDSYAGFILEEEVGHLKKIVESPKEGKIIIMGGAKAGTKVPVIKNFIDKADKIIIGGVVANDILKERGDDIGDSVADKNTSELLEGLDIKDERLVLPEDFNISDNKFLDIGPKTIARYEDIIKNAQVIVWNGPMGMFENPGFDAGTNSIATAVAGAKAYKVIGGGDTIAAVNKIGLLEKFDFVSTGGGAMLAFLSGEKLPGLEALGYYN